MDNPWPNLPASAPFVLESDRAIVDAFNRRLDKRSLGTLQTRLMPEPFIGNPAAPIYILGLNPGFSKEDSKWHRKAEFLAASRLNLNHKTKSFLFLDPRFAMCPGSKWWRKRLRWLIEDTSESEVSRSIFCVELFAYHSKKYRSIPKTVSANKLVPSSDYGAHLVRNAISLDKAIVALRAWKPWCKLVPELAGYKNVFRLNSPQNSAMSPKNLGRYQEISARIKHA